MKAEIHPDNYRQVIFLDTSSDEKFLVYSTVETEETGEYEGEEYPLYRIEISSASHPFYTGKETTIDTAGRVEKFKARFAKAKEKQEELKKKSSGETNKTKGGDQEETDESSNREE